MGRRPNPLVVEFFERGAKLADNSNRYQHTCKRCGEEFPKGRIDSLTSHLLRKCPNVTHDDREWVFHQIQQNPERQNSSKKDLSKSLLPMIQQEGLDSEHVLSIHQQHQQSALDTLAEVSRRHLDYSTQRATDHGETGVVSKTFGEIMTEQALIAELRGHEHLKAPVNIKSTKSHLYTKDVPSHQARHRPETPLMRRTALAASPLVETASAANQQLELAQGQTLKNGPDNSLVDPQLSEVTRSSDRQSTQNLVSGPETMSCRPATVPVALQTFGSLSAPLPEPTSRFGLLQKSAQSKKRGRFDDNRRKEVSEIRKRGACIRCRMLKKPCSGETPCSTCSTVESARLWKGKCLRTRLADEFTLWSANLFHSQAKIEVAAGVQGLYQVPLPGRIEARFFRASSLCMIFQVKAHSENLEAIDPALNHEHDLEADGSNSIYLLDEGDTMVDKIEEYINQVGECCINEEPSLFVRSTLQRAQELVKAEEAERLKAAEVHEQRSPRSSYNLQSQLLKNVIELWIQTQLLTSQERHVLQLQYDMFKMPQRGSEHVHWVGEGDESTNRTIPDSSPSYRLIQDQLLAAVESRCSKLGRIVMNELERRLLQRQQVSRFATFLSSVILLNGVERMCGFYRSLHAGGTQLARPSREPPARSFGAIEEMDNPSRSLANQISWNDMAYRIGGDPKSWPLDTPPSKLWPQGQDFSDLLILLLRVRALPPKTGQKSDGTLAAAQELSVPIHVTGQSVKEQIDEQTKTAAAWLDPLRLSVTELAMTRDREPPIEGGVDSWDMKFVSKLLLPERI